MCLESIKISYVVFQFEQGFFPLFLKQAVLVAPLDFLEINGKGLHKLEYFYNICVYFRNSKIYDAYLLK